MRPYQLLFGVCLLTSCAVTPINSDTSLTPSLLNASKSEYNGKRVKVRGWMRSEFENYGLWENKKANENGTFARDCVSLLTPESMNAGQFNKHYVEIDGIFAEHLPENFVQLGGCNVTTLKLIKENPPVLKPAP